MPDTPQFDPSGAGNTGGGIFGLPFEEADAALIYYPVPWEVTVSYRAGTARGPEAILKASPQLDLLDHVHGEVWQHGLAMTDPHDGLRRKSDWARPKAEQVIQWLEQGEDPAGNAMITELLEEVNRACEGMVQSVQEGTAMLLDQGKKVILVGGDHSTPLGYLKALAERHSTFGILQIDAHMDLREAYEGFTYSHASIMHNALQLPEVKKLVQVGIRDLSPEEMGKIEAEEGKVRLHTMPSLRRGQYAGATWGQLVDEMIADLPQEVYVSFDIDGLEPHLCPHTGTPVPEGLRFEEAMYLIDCVVDSGRTIIGADLVEVAPGPVGDEWDGSVGARVLYHLAGAMLTPEQ